jgi:hypothetical protein
MNAGENDLCNLVRVTYVSGEHATSTIQAVSCRAFPAENGFRTQTTPRWRESVCGGQSDMRTEISPNTSAFLYHYHSNISVRIVIQPHSTV